MKQRTNRWTKWHPRSPIFEAKTDDDLDWLIWLEANAKQFMEDLSTKPKDIVQQRERKIKIAIVKFVCTECTHIADTRGAIAFHIMRDHLFPRTIALKKAEKADETIVPRELTNVMLYYEVVRPRKIIPVPKSVEVDIPTGWWPEWPKDKDKLDRPIYKRPFEAQVMPTHYERERHDKEMKKWREDMVSQPRPDHLERLPNGLFNDPGLSGNWWYYIPHVWRQKARKGKGAWLEATEHECLNWAKVKLPKRVLFLLCIVEDK